MAANVDVLQLIQIDLRKGLAEAGSHKSPFTRSLAKQYYRTYFQDAPEKVLRNSEKLLQDNDTWQHMVACEWLSRSLVDIGPAPFVKYERWLYRYIFSWGTCDDYCKRVLNPQWKKDYRLIKNIRKWTQARRKWVRRASVAIFIKSENGGYSSATLIKYMFDLAERLIMDKDMHVQKGYGWILKAASIHHQREVFDFVIRNKEIMPRTAFRFTIEKMPEPLWKEAIAR